MNRSSKLSLLMVDLVGGALVLACVLLLGWTLLFRADATAADMRQWEETARNARHDIGSLRTRRSAEQTLLETRQLELAQSGQLPERAPIDQYFQTLSDTARRLDLRVLRQSPLATQHYDGLTEQRFNYEVTGTFADLMAFLKAIEQTEYWVDVSYISIEGHTSGASTQRNERIAQLTLSLFAAPATTPTKEPTAP